MATVAEQLREARESRKLTIQQVAEITKIRADHVRAIEEGNFDAFSAPVYIRGFVRTYATLLKVEVPSLMAELDAELNQTSRFSEPPPLSEKQGGIIDAVMLGLSRFDWRKGAVGLGLLGLLAVVLSMYFSWQKNKTRDPLQGVKAPLYQTTQSVSGDMLAVPQAGRK